MTARKRWIAGQLEPKGVVQIDAGAEKALLSGKSLLPAGVTRVEGAFERGDAVVIRAADGRELGRGLVAYAQRRRGAYHRQEERRDRRHPRLRGPRRADPSRRHGAEQEPERMSRRTNASPRRLENVADAMRALGAQAREAARALALALDRKPRTPRSLPPRASCARSTPAILAANALDLAAAAEAKRPAAFLDRLTLDPKRIEAMAKGLEDIAALPDPVGSVLAQWTRPNGLEIERVRVPLGVIGIIYESRPNVTADAGALCLKAGNAAILRGGSDSHHSSRAIQVCLARGLREAGLPETAIQLVPTTDRAAVGLMLQGPRRRHRRDRAARRQEPGRARAGRGARAGVRAPGRHLPHLRRPQRRPRRWPRRIVVNAKMRRTGVCGATETLLVDTGRARRHAEAADRRAARGRLRGARRRRRAAGRCARASRPPSRTGRPNISTPSSP